LLYERFFLVYEQLPGASRALFGRNHWALSTALAVGTKVFSRKKNRAFEYIPETARLTPEFLRTRPRAVAFHRNNICVGSIGGPIFKDRHLSSFADYEGLNATPGIHTGDSRLRITFANSLGMDNSVAPPIADRTTTIQLGGFSQWGFSFKAVFNPLPKWSLLCPFAVLCGWVERETRHIHLAKEPTIHA